MQALAGSFGGRSQAFKAHRGVDQVTQNDTGRRRLTIEEQRRRLVQQRCGERRFAPHPLTDGLLEVSAQRHDSPHSRGPGLRARYASFICMARLMSLFWLALVPPVNSTISVCPPHQIDAVTRPPVDPVLADTTKPLHAGCIAHLHPQPRSRHRSEEHTSELQSLMRISYAVF